jgi:hypothetical protein
MNAGQYRLFSKPYHFTTHLSPRRCINSEHETAPLNNLKINLVEIMTKSERAYI